MTRDPAQRLSDAINAMLDSHADKVLATVRAMLDRYRRVDDAVVPETDEEVIERLATGHDACVVRAAEALAAKDEARRLRNELAEMRQRMQSQRAGAIRASGSEAEQDRIRPQMDLGARINALWARERLGEVTRELDKHRILDAPNSASALIESDIDVIRRLAAHYYATPQAPTTATTPMQVVQNIRAVLGNDLDGTDVEAMTTATTPTATPASPVLAIGQVWETPLGWRWRCDIAPPATAEKPARISLATPPWVYTLTIDKGGRVINSEGCRLVSIDADGIESVTGPWSTT